MGTISVADDGIELELEAKRREDSSWHQCRVSLSSSEDGVILNIGSEESEDLFLTKEEVLTHLRFPSTPLKSDDCYHIKEGEHVLATACRTESKALFLDAVVEKVERVRHSRRCCRCTFMIKWLHQNLEGQTLTVPSCSIKKLATKSISVHPKIAMFYESGKESKDISTAVSPLLNVNEDTDAGPGMHLDKMLGTQVEQICNLAKGAPDDENHLKKMNQNPRKLQGDTESEDSPASAAHNLSGKKLHLNPLASRAALASSLLNTPKCDFGSHISSDKTMMDKIPSEISAVPNQAVSEPANVESPLFLTQRDASLKPQLTELSASIPTEMWRNENKSLEKTSCYAESRTSDVAKKAAEVRNSNTENKTLELSIYSAKKKTPSLATLSASSTGMETLTRSAVQKATGNPRYDVPMKNCDDETNRKASSNKRRFTRSAVYKEKEVLTMEEDNKVAHITDSDFPEASSSVPESDVSKKKSTILRKKNEFSLPLGAESHSLNEEMNRSQASYALETTQKTEGNRSNPGQKSKVISSKKKLRRFSPRNFLPRTRSQNKSQPGKYRGTISFS